MIHSLKRLQSETLKILEFCYDPVSKLTGNSLLLRVNTGFRVIAGLSSQPFVVSIVECLIFELCME